MKNYEVISVDAVVVGTGAAGYNAACRIAQYGHIGNGRLCRIGGSRFIARPARI